MISIPKTKKPNVTSQSRCRIYIYIEKRMKIQKSDENQIDFLYKINLKTLASVFYLSNFGFQFSSNIIHNRMKNQGTYGLCG
jgi:hypothetical protein